MNKLRSGKLFPVFVALSAVVIIAGIVLWALFGYNTSADKPETYTFEVEYGVAVEIADKEGELQTACESEFSSRGLTGYTKTVVPALSASSLEETTDHVLIYEFPKSASRDALIAARDVINGKDFGGEFSASVRHYTEETFGTDAVWRGALGIAVGVVAALFYVGVRFGVANGVAGFVCCVHDALFTAAFFALTRIPVFAYAPLLYAAVAAACSMVVWIFACMKWRENAKTPEYASMTGAEAVRTSVFSSWKTVVTVAGVLAAVIAVFGLVAAGGVRSLVLPMLVPAVIPVYSCFLIGPEVAAPIRKSLDARKAKKKGGYVGKKKAEQTQE